ncbi:MAG: hypothetical protein C0451_03325 [Comamonadaceae bacterium]|nr:hypothetical protein [Comamonadaceae bacterium]
MSKHTPLEYEEFVRKVVESLVGVDVFQGREFEGRIAGRKIKVDASFVLRIAGGADMLVLVECKHYNHRVPVDDIEEFHSKIDDIGAQKGILITTVGFQAGAVKAATGRRIALALLTEDHRSGEIEYVASYATQFVFTPNQSVEFFQGKIRCLLLAGERGMRFNSFSQVIGMLIVDAHAE